MLVAPGVVSGVGDQGAGLEERDEVEELIESPAVATRTAESVEPGARSWNGAWKVTREPLRWKAAATDSKSADEDSSKARASK